ncbi:MAG: DNA-binding protein [Tatlockia sp.]|nr:DNA-binding protein [Tatlockia sp.]
MSTRITLVVSDELNEALASVAKDTSSTKSDVLRKSIALLQMAVNEKKAGNHLGVFDKKQKIVKEIVGF